MYKSKRYEYDYDDYEEGDKSAETMVADIMADEEFPSLEGIIIGSWGDAWEGSCQNIIDDIVKNKDKFSHIKSLFIGDMGFEDCEVSWIIQADYSKLWEAMPQLESLTVKGSTDLSLGTIKHDNLKKLEIICGGLPSDIINSITKAELPSLETLILYIGVEDYGFDGDKYTIKRLLENSNFPALKYLGLEDSEIQDDIAELVFDCKYISQIETLDLANGTLTNKGGQLIADKLKDYPNIKKVDLHYHFMTDEIMDKLDDLADELDIDIDVDEDNEPDEYDDEIYYYPMLTE
ncbi:MAG: cytoplasmic protein [Lachnospiraceae bacterium]|nr:cytoplasmic protein [Lachnospiraceae bacterium]